MKHLIYPLVFLACISTPLTAQQQQAESAKLEVTDAPVLGKGAMEMEFGYQFVRGLDANGTPAHSDGTAAFTLAYGLSERLDLFGGVCWCDQHRQDASLQGGSGLGDGVAGFKYQFLGTPDDVWSMSTLAALQFPLGMSFGVGGLRPGSDVWSISPAITASMNKRHISITASIAGVLPIERSDESAMMMMSAAAGYQVHSRIQPVLEVNYMSGMAGVTASPSWSGGVVLGMTEYLRLTAGLRSHRPDGADGHERCGFFRMTVAM